MKILTEAAIPAEWIRYFSFTSTLLKLKESTNSGHAYDSLQLVRLHRKVKNSGFLLDKSTVLLNRARHGSNTNCALADAT